jgi:octaprenyl-diphosphate synthase
VIQDRLDTVKNQIAIFVKEMDDSNSEKLFDSIEHGKLMRSKLMLNICYDEKIIKLCAIIELIHLASLLHDDVIDNSTLRRKKPTINALFGEHSVMFGDILYSKAFYELTNFDSFIAKTVANAVNVLSIGELEDVEMSKSFNNDKQKYFSMLYKKTGVLIEASCISSAFLAEEDHEAIGLFGRNLGIAFQIIDDILDVTMDDTTLGKAAFGDFREGKSTLPYIFVYEMADEVEQKKLMTLFKVEPNQEDKTWLKALFEKYGIIDRCKNEALALTTDAIQRVSLIKNRQVADTLIEIAKTQITRNF